MSEIIGRHLLFGDEFIRKCLFLFSKILNFENSSTNIKFGYVLWTTYVIYIQQVTSSKIFKFSRIPKIIYANGFIMEIINK